MFAFDYFARRAKRIWQKFQPEPIPPAIGRVRCREITPDDHEAIIDLLTKGFWRLPREHWARVMRVLATHHSPEGYPRYGYMLENDGTAVGVLLTIFTSRVIDNVTHIWCNETSYYVEPPFRFYASLLVKRAHRFKEVTYLDLTPSSHRFTTLTAQGYKKIAQGVYIAFPWLCRTVPGVSIRRISSNQQLDCHEGNMLIEHAQFAKCLPVVCEHQGVIYPFIFVVRRRYGIPFAFLIYSGNEADFARFAGTLGRFMAKKGIPAILLDVNAAIAGVPGKLVSQYPKYWKGSNAPRLGDLAYTEIPMFGVL